MYTLFYESIEERGSWVRAEAGESEVLLACLIEVSDDEQDQYDSCWIEDGYGNIVYPEA